MANLLGCGRRPLQTRETYSHSCCQVCFHIVTPVIEESGHPLVMSSLYAEICFIYGLAKCLRISCWVDIRLQIISITNMLYMPVKSNSFTYRRVLVSTHWPRHFGPRWPALQRVFSYKRIELRWCLCGCDSDDGGEQEAAG